MDSPSRSSWEPTPPTSVEISGRDFKRGGLQAEDFSFAGIKPSDDTPSVSEDITSETVRLRREHTGKNFLGEFPKIMTTKHSSGPTLLASGPSSINVHETERGGEASLDESTQLECSSSMQFRHSLDAHDPPFQIPNFTVPGSNFSPLPSLGPNYGSWPSRTPKIDSASDDVVQQRVAGDLATTMLPGTSWLFPIMRQSEGSPRSTKSFLPPVRSDLHSKDDFDTYVAQRSGQQEQHSQFSEEQEMSSSSTSPLSSLNVNMQKEASATIPVGPDTPTERSRRQNSIAQTAYLQELERDHSDEPIVIECVCHDTSDVNANIPCVTCGKWQHIDCYYTTAQTVIRNHECVQCRPNELQDDERRSSKRPASMDEDQDTESSATLIPKRPKPNVARPLKLDNSDNYSAAQTLMESKSNYQSMLDGAYPSVVYPEFLATRKTSKRTSHKIAEQGRRNRINNALQEIQDQLPIAEENASGSIFDTVSEARNSKAAKVESAISYIKQLKGEALEKDILLEAKDREIMQLKKLMATRPDHVPWNILGPWDTSRLVNDLLLPSSLFEGWDDVGKLQNFDFDSFLHSDQQAHSSGLPRDCFNPHDSDSQDRATLPRTDKKDMNTKEMIAVEHPEPRVPPKNPPVLRRVAQRRLTWKKSTRQADEDQPIMISPPESRTPHHLSQQKFHGRALSTDNATGVLDEDENDEKPGLTGTGSLNSNNRMSMELSSNNLLDANLLTNNNLALGDDWNAVQDLLPETWKWDVEYQSNCWTCTPLEANTPDHYPLTIANAPVVIPVEHQWPPIGGVNPPPDPRPSIPIDCRAHLAINVVRDILLTFQGSIGFYVLISGLLQIIVPEDFDTAWASSHLPHKFGHLKVSYISQTLEKTMLPSTVEETTKSKPSLNTQTSSMSSIFSQSRPSSYIPSPTLKLNDFIEARPKSKYRNDKYSGRIGLKVVKDGEPYIVMSTHIVTEAIITKSYRGALFGRSRGRVEKLDNDWNNHVEIWAGNEKMGNINQTFDHEAEIYPNGFHHDVSLIKPTSASSVKDIVSPIPNLGWLDRESWNSLRQQTSVVKILGPTESPRSAKSVKCSRPSEILVVGEGIFLNQTAAAGNSKSLKDHDMSTWKDLVSRAVLYRVYPDFNPPNGYSGAALYADGRRQDGTQGPGIAGFQSFVQRSGHVQNFNMEGSALEKRLQLGRVAFYGAFEVPEDLKREYTIA
jgi:hypothetical protein